MAALQLAATHLPLRLQSRVWQGNPLAGESEAPWARHGRMPLCAVSVDIFKRRGPPPAQPLVITLPLQESVLPQSGASPAAPRPGINHVVDRRHLAVVAAGGHDTAHAARAAHVTHVTPAVSGAGIPAGHST